MARNTIVVPADVPKEIEQIYIDNYNAITRNTGRLFLFACDQKIEHLNADFHGPDIAKQAQDPRHVFEIASAGSIGAFATHLGLIARYGKEYATINYIVKLNGKTDLVPIKQQDPESIQLWSVDDVLRFKQDSGLPIRGIGYTVYLGSMYEKRMLEQAAHAVFQAHQHGLIAIIWMYPRGVNVLDDTDPELLAGAVGVAASLGADFVKIKAPKHVVDLQKIVTAAGNTKVICSGGVLEDSRVFLHNLYEQIHVGGVAGCAVGRNIFQKSRSEAIAFVKEIAAIVFDDLSRAS